VNSDQKVLEKEGYIPHAVVGLMIENDNNLIKAWRLYRGLTQAQLAEQSGLKQSAIARLESNVHAPTFATREKLAKAMDIHPQQLTLDEG